MTKNRLAELWARARETLRNAHVKIAEADNLVNYRGTGEPAMAAAARLMNEAEDLMRQTNELHLQIIEGVRVLNAQKLRYLH